MDPHFFTDGDVKVAWYKTGTGRPLLCLHGWGSSSELMKPVAENLADIRCSYLLDFPGFGQSPEPPSAWSVDDYSNLTRNFIKSELPNGKTDLLVHSYGARVAIKLLADPSFSERIGKVIFTGGAGLKPKRKPSYYFRKYTAKLLKLPFMILPGSLSEKSLNWLRATPLWKSLGSSDYQTLSGVMRETFVKSVTEYLDDQLGQIQHEVLLIWGENDQATPMDQAKRMEKGLKNGTLVVIKEAGHYAFLDQPRQFSAIARAYLEPDG
ncbi:MAG: alpha/beta hydrolase [Balneolaceae bacterium]|nr:alpha/beta hydrolase [Balneolaceae bacterium]MCH8548885.1 alpha/beta hydrolase [Balneolaceae bacterium]